MKVFLCESCGGPMDAPWDQLVIVCPACGTQNLDGGSPVPPRVPVDERPRLNLGGRTWVLERRIAQGDSSDVYAGRWVVRLGERVVIKVDATGDDGLLRNEHRVLSALMRSRAQGATHFRQRLPAPVALGVHRGRVAAVYGWKSGFVHTLEQVGQRHESGVGSRAGVWLLKRLLELLGFVHASGFAHGAITPAHVLVHPKDHGAMLVGWTVAGELGTRRASFPAAWSALRGGDLLAAEDDIRMACTIVSAVAGWSGPLAALAAQGGSDAWALVDELSRVSAQVHGASGYNPIDMGW